jgi:hypothetical protein
MVCSNILFRCAKLSLVTKKAAKPMHASIERLYGIARGHGDAAPADVARSLNISAQTLHNWEKRGISKAGANEAGRVYRCDPLTILDGPLAQPSEVQPIFTKERRASDDVLALQVALESLVVAVLQRTQGSAAAFLEDVERVAEESHFSPEQGFLGGLVEIAREVRSAEEAATQVLRRAGSGRYTKRGK